ncbi:putative metallopeptidase DUF4344 [Maritimibacter alkaliphilus HTCC2654]|uniref:Metallopeptidase n=1 Tax=Maritimibacter alkaliphilus HTCC2654 TaxID=314271 RepID=A3VBW0_9RHOB|nr:hypothetical protein RB2654_17276 [Rhodobacterales bacterium HTCC2654] [Maritimibacter alkaliphilus HTCC2654]TYP82466.1 putative metallopeptidase DUF4344 [Maritimibacter alkaliphilus HTCC2654]
MRFAAAIALALSLSPAHAEGDKDFYTFAKPGGQTLQAAPARVDPVQLYVEANVTETLYHELAHALIGLLDLPIYGPEEFAADTFAVVLMNRLHDDVTVQRMAGDVARNYWLFAEGAGKHRDDLSLWDVHGPDLQRYYNFACLMYGVDTDMRADLVDLFDLPEARARTCDEEYALAETSWNAVLDGLVTDAPGQTIRLDWVMNEDDHLTRFVRSEVARLNAEMVLPETLNISVIPCGEANAFYDPGLLEIQICTEFGEELANMAR